MDARKSLPKWLTFTPAERSATAFRMHGGQSSSSAPTNAIASLVFWASKLRTIPTGSARRTARSVVTSAIFSIPSCSTSDLMCSRSKRASLAVDEYFCSLCKRIMPASISQLGRRQRFPVILGQTSMKSARLSFHSRPSWDWRKDWISVPTMPR